MVWPPAYPIQKAMEAAGLIRAGRRAGSAPCGAQVRVGASSGRNSSTGSSSRSLHSSTRIIAAAAVIGFVIEAMRPKSGDLGAVRYSSQDGNHRHRARERRIIGLKFDKFNDALC